MHQDDKAEYRRLLDEIGEEYCKAGTYCIFKEFLIAAHPSRRLLVQLKCCDRMKFIKSKDVGRDIGWEAVLRMWVDEGHAKRFSEVYDDTHTDKQIFDKILG